MPFTPEEIARLDALLATSDGGPQLTAQVRELLPGRSITRCDVSDMAAEEPFRCYERVELHLVDGRDHCWRLTTDAAVATGVVLAARRKRS
jgi:hypothetical protein